MSPRSTRSRVWLGVESLEDRLAPATFTVSNINNNGPGSLRAAINAANGNPGADVIAFNIAGDWVHKIDLLSALPAISEKATITGVTQPGYAGTPRIVLNGTAAGARGQTSRTDFSSPIGIMIRWRWIAVMRTLPRLGCFIGRPVSMRLGNGAAGVRVSGGRMPRLGTYELRRNVVNGAPGSITGAGAPTPIRSLEHHRPEA